MHLQKHAQTIVCLLGFSLILLGNFVHASWNVHLRHPPRLPEVAGNGVSNVIHASDMQTVLPPLNFETATDDIITIFERRIDSIINVATGLEEVKTW
jgi:hypothetical protein